MGSAEADGRTAGTRRRLLHRPHDPASHRRLLLVVAMATLTAAIVGVALTRADAARRRWGPTAPVVVTAMALPAGTDIGEEHLVVATWPASLVPEGALGDPGDLVGQRTAAPLAKGTPLTGESVLDPDDDARDHVTLRAGPEMPPLEPGRRVSIWATTAPSSTGGGPGTRTIAEDAVVVSVDDERIVLGVSPDRTAEVVEAIVLSTITLVSGP